jgi:hypothetical protein
MTASSNAKMSTKGPKKHEKVRKHVTPKEQNNSLSIKPQRKGNLWKCLKSNSK